MKVGFNPLVFALSGVFVWLIYGAVVSAACGAAGLLLYGAFLLVCNDASGGNYVAGGILLCIAICVGMILRERLRDPRNFLDQH
jgi:hypothetical protein